MHTKLVILILCLLLLGGCSQTEVAQSQPPIPSSAESDTPDSPPFMGELSTPAEMTPATPSSANKDFAELYPNGLFRVSIVDCADTPVPNAAVTVNLDWPMTAQRTTDADGALLLPLPQLSSTAFVSGSYKFTITQPTLTEPLSETVVCTLSQQNTSNGYTIKLLSPIAKIDWSQAKQSLAILVYKRGVPQKNLAVTLLPSGYNHPDSGYSPPDTLQYTDANGSVRYANIPAGDYTAEVKGDGGVQLVAQPLTATGSGTETLRIDLPVELNE